MKLKQKHQQIILSMLFISFIVLTLMMIFNERVSAANTIYGNYRNVSIQTRVNITNTKPEVLGVRVYQETNYSARNITLSAGALRQVTCNGTLRDWNGYGDIGGANATLWNPTATTHTAPDDNNSHYFNSTCTNISALTAYTVEYICTFDVYYYANNGSWVCNMTAIDSRTKTGFGSNTTIFYPLYALNVTDGMDFGNVEVEEYSINTTANITNFGNKAINISVEGWGAIRGDGLAMNCSLNGNISVANERFSLEEMVHNSKIALSSANQLIPNITIAKQTDPAIQMTNTTRWSLYLDSTANPGGNCTGYILFSAQIP